MNSAAITLDRSPTSQVDGAAQRSAAQHGARWQGAIKLDRFGTIHVIGAVVMGALGVLAMLPAWQDIYLIAARDEENSHIFLVPIVALYLIWVRRSRLRHCAPSFRMIGPIIVAVGWIISLIGFYHGIQSFWHGGAVLVLI